MPLERKTPGVYITEIDAFPKAGDPVTGVATAVPVFIGYTEFAGVPHSGQPLYNTPVPVASLAEFRQSFGGSAAALFAVEALPQPGTDTKAIRVSPRANPAGPDRFCLARQIELFYANGGGNCVVVSVGSYWADQQPVSVPDAIPDTWQTETIAAEALLTGLTAAEHTTGITMIVVPEACQLPSDGYGKVVQAMLTQASALQDRMAIFDLPGCLSATTLADVQCGQTGLADAMAPVLDKASYGAAYAPALRTTIAREPDLDIAAFRAPDGDNGTLNGLLTAEALQFYEGAERTQVQQAIAAAFPCPGPATNSATLSNDPAGYPALADATAWRATLDNLLSITLPTYAEVKAQALALLNIAPPSGGVAGVWSANDANRGVWAAPANIALASVSAPLCDIDNDAQPAFNLPINGEAINIIRSMPSRGTVIWGARTLDGNSLDYRYINVRRTLIYIEQSVKLALQAFVFERNDAATWTAVTASVSSFLTGLWQAGGLVGAKPADAFKVACGLGTTMTGEDILNSYMRAAVTVAVTHPAEFIELTFTQTMAG